MKKVLTVLLVLMIIGACRGTSSNVRQFVRASGDYPQWIDISQSDDDYMYFSGVSSSAADLEEGKNKAFMNASYDLLAYIGIRVDVELYQQKEYYEEDDVVTYIEEMYDYVGASGSADVEIRKEEVYYEYFSDGSVDVYMLISCSHDTVEDAREQIALLAEEQGKIAREAMSNSTAAVERGDISTALTEAYTALYTAEKAFENIAIFDEAKVMIYSILSGLSFSLVNNPQYAYYEGGSDDIIVQVTSSQSDTPVTGLLVKAEEINGGAELASQSGYSTDSDGKVIFNVSEFTEGSKKLEVAVTYSLEGMYEIENLNKAFLEELESLQENLSLEMTLDFASAEMVVQTAVVVVSGVKESINYSEVAVNDGLQTEIAGLLSDEGFLITAVSVPGTVLSSKVSADNILESVIAYVNENYPDVKRLMYGLESVMYLGANPVRETWRSAQVDLSLTLIDLESNEVLKSSSLSGTSVGISDDQAADNAEEKIYDELEQELSEL